MKEGDSKMIMTSKDTKIFEFIRNIGFGQVTLTLKLNIGDNRWGFYPT